MFTTLPLELFVCREVAPFSPCRIVAQGDHADHGLKRASARVPHGLKLRATDVVVLVTVRRVLDLQHVGGRVGGAHGGGAFGKGSLTKARLGPPFYMAALGEVPFGIDNGLYGGMGRFGERECGDSGKSIERRTQRWGCGALGERLYRKEHGEKKYRSNHCAFETRFSGWTIT